MVLYKNGLLVGVRVRNGQWSYVRRSLILPFVNVGACEGMVYAVDSVGHVYAVDPMLMKVTYTIVVVNTMDLCGKTYPSCPSFSSNNKSSKINHHLVECERDLYLVVWDRLYSDSSSSPVEPFTAYKLDRGQQKWVCVECVNYGVFFVSPDWCFAVFNKDHIRLRKAIVYNPSCFANPHYVVCQSYSLFRGQTVDLDIHMFLEYNKSSNWDHGSDRAISFKDIADMMWPPPTWLWPDTYSSISDEDEHQESQIYIDEVSNASEDEVMFKDLDIRSDLVPILKKIWAKHGNILEGSKVQSKIMISCALVSLAEVIIILEGNSGRTLTEVLCNDITSTLCDLKYMEIRIDWLFPFVEKAVALHVSKPMIAALTKLDKAIARANKIKFKFSDDLANLNELARALEEDRARLFDRIPIPEPVDLDKCLANGIF